MSAATAGRVRYIGGTCATCGQRVRYTSSGGCVACHAEKAAEHAKRVRKTLRDAKGE